MSITLDRFGRILIPKKLRDQAGFRPGDDLEVVPSGSGLELRRAAAVGTVVLRNGVPVYTGAVADPGADLVAEDRDERHREILRRAGFATGE